MKKRGAFNRETREDPTPIGLSGWLFTDLLLGLLIVFAAGAVVISAGDDSHDAEELKYSEKDFKEIEKKNAEEIEEIEQEYAAAVEEVEEKNAEAIEEIEKKNAEAIEEIEQENAAAVEEIEQKYAAAVEEVEDKNAEEIRKIEQKNAEAIEEIEKRNVAEITELKKRGIEQNYYCLRIENVGVGSSEARFKEEIRQKINRKLTDKNLQDRKVGIALLFAVTTRENGTGTAGSTWLKEEIEDNTSIYDTFTGSVIRPFLTYTGPDVGDILMNLYFWSGSEYQLLTEDQKDC